MKTTLRALIMASACIGGVACSVGSGGESDGVLPLRLVDVNEDAFLGGTYSDGQLDMVPEVRAAIEKAEWDLDDVVLRVSAQQFAFPTDDLLRVEALDVGSVVSIESTDGALRLPSRSPDC